MKHLDALKDAKLMPLWHDSEARPEVQPALANDEQCDLLIVGGGYIASEFAGMWLAVRRRS